MRPFLEPEHVPPPEKEFSLSAFKGACSAASVTWDKVQRGLWSVILDVSEFKTQVPFPIPWSHSPDMLPVSTLHLTPGPHSLQTAAATPACEISACSYLILPPCLPTQNLRVRSIGGTEFFTRSATKFKGVLAQKFMFVDGDRAVCGSYR